MQSNQFTFKYYEIQLYPGMKRTNIKLIEVKVPTRQRLQIYKAEHQLWSYDLAINDLLDFYQDNK